MSPWCIAIAHWLFCADATVSVWCLTGRVMGHDNSCGSTFCLGMEVSVVGDAPVAVGSRRSLSPGAAVISNVELVSKEGSRHRRARGSTAVAMIFKIQFPATSM